MVKKVIVLVLLFFPIIVTGQKPIQEIHGNYRGGEPTIRILKKFLRTYDIKYVIRCNGNGADKHAMTVQQEKKIVESFGIDFIYLPMPRKENFERWANEVSKYLNQGKVFVHCHYGHDRTGFLIGYWLMKFKGYTFDEVREMNGWKKHDVYSRQFYPVLLNLDRKNKEK